MADLDVNGVNKVFRKLFRELLAMPENSVRPANQNAPAGAKDEQFATVLVTMLPSPLFADRKFRDLPTPSTEVEETLQGQRGVTVSVQFFRGDAYTKAERLGMLLQTSAAIDKMQALGIGLVRVGTARNLTAAVDTFWEERGQIDLEFYLVAKVVSNLPTYGRFPIAVSTESSTTSSEVIAP